MKRLVGPVSRVDEAWRALYALEAQRIAYRVDRLAQKVGGIPEAEFALVEAARLVRVAEGFLRK